MGGRYSSDSMLSNLHKLITAFSAALRTTVGNAIIDVWNTFDEKVHNAEYMDKLLEDDSLVTKAKMISQILTATDDIKFNKVFEKVNPNTKSIYREDKCIWVDALSELVNDRIEKREDSADPMTSNLKKIIDRVRNANDLVCAEFLTTVDDAIIKVRSDLGSSWSVD